jgi:hypothetical protein
MREAQDVPATSWYEFLRAEDIGVLEAALRVTGLRGDPEALERALASEEAHAVLLGESGREEVIVAHPRLLFSVIVSRARGDLATTNYLPEWVGPRQRVPLLGTKEALELLGVRAIRLYLASLLSSYSRVASGAVLEWTPKGIRRRRFSELDPLALASLLEVVRPEERPLVLRRLGDLMLFLTGVFPDHTERRGLKPLHVARLAAYLGIREPELLDRDLPVVATLQQLGARAYATAASRAILPGDWQSAAASRLAQSFPLARRVLDGITQRYLFPYRGTLFGVSPS